MIRLLELKFVGIGRFTQMQTIDFRNRGKLIQFDGQNNNTGGSSGSGKTSVFNALMYNLGLSDIPTTVLQSRVTKTTIATESLLDVDGVIVQISRSKKNGLALKIGEETITGDIKLAEERLEQLIGIPLKLFKKMIHKKQKEGGFFLKLTAKESFDFLIKVLGLEHWTLKIDKIDKDIASLTALNSKLMADQENISNVIKGYQSTIDSVTKPILSVNPEDVNTLQTQIDCIKELITEIEKEQLLRVSEIPAITKASVVYDDSLINTIERQITDLKANKLVLETTNKEARKKLTDIVSETKDKITSIGFLKKDLIGITDQIKALKDSKAHIEAASCPTCAQTWIGDSATIKIDSINTQLKSFAEKAWDIKSKLDLEPELTATLDSLYLKIEILDTTVSYKEIEEEISSYNQNLSDEKSKKKAYADTVDSQYETDKTKYDLQVLTCKNLYTEKLTNAKQSLTAIETKQRELKTAIDNYNEQLVNYTKTIENSHKAIQDQLAKNNSLVLQQGLIAQSLLVASESKRLIKNYTLQIFQESLDYIGDQATQIMSKIPNMSSASIYFEGCKEAKNGNIKDEVNPIVNLDGENEVPFKSLSGGEETSIELAVDLAVIDMIEHKTGKGADFFILDEPFTGLDSINSEKVMYMLTMLDTSKKIMIVDHNESVKAMVNETIIVVRNDEESNVIS